MTQGIYAEHVLDVPSVLMRQVESRYAKRLHTESLSAPRRLRKRLLHRIDSGLTGQEAAEVLESFMRQIETELGELLQQHSVYYWFHLTRRVPPIPQFGASAWSAELSQQVLDLAIRKYGTDSHPFSGDEFITDGGGLRVRDIGFFDVLAVRCAFALAYEYWNATARYRMVCKGAPLTQDGRDLLTTPDSTLAFLTRSVDARSTQTEEFADIGACVRSESNSQLEHCILIPTPNRRSESYPISTFGALNFERFGGQPNAFSPHYLPAPLDLGRLRTALDPYREQVRAHINLDPEEVCWFLTAVGLRASAGIVRESSSAFEFLHRATWLYSDPPEQYFADLAETYSLTGIEGLPPQDQLCDVFRRGFAGLVLESASRSKIDLWSRTPWSIFIPVEDGFLLDLNAVVPALHDMLYALGETDGAAGCVKGDIFQRRVHAILVDSGFVTWLHSSDLKVDGITRDIDTSCVVGDTMYVIECKAPLHTHRLDRGEWGPLQSRWQLLTDALDQASSLVDILQQYRLGSNYEVPPEVRNFVPVVCTPHAEYIPSRDTAYWLTDSIPRICTPKELVTFLRASTSELTG